MIFSYEGIKTFTDVQKHFHRMGSCFIRDLSNSSITNIMCLPPNSYGVALSAQYLRM